MIIYDVSIQIKEDMIVYPGNPKPKIIKYRSIPEDKTNESIISIGSHTGTHVDAKTHISNSLFGSETLPLESFYGKSRVIDLTFIKSEICRKDLQEYNLSDGEIILLKTRNSLMLNNEFSSDYVHIKKDAASYVVEAGVKTLGFDYLSVKKRGKDHEVHEILINSLTLFEGLNLSNVPQGEYIFIGLPLRIRCDGAPSRVVLLKNS